MVFMKLITTQIELEREFRRLTKQYSEFYWATAWAGVNTRPFDDLISKQKKIRNIVVGIHFYQTHPNFIKTFRSNRKVRFILQPEGTFHPKIYLFVDNNKWELLVGSGNFTNGAFNKNKEATILISQDDINSQKIFNDAKKFILDNWKSAKYLTEKELDNYEITWRNLLPKINSLSGQYGSVKRKSKPIHEVAIISKSWKEFMDDVRGEKFHGLDERLKVIEIASNLFETYRHFNLLTEDERKFIAGIPNKLETDGAVDWGYFGSMKGAGIYKNKILKNDINISKALDQIPYAGQITKNHFDRFIKEFSKVCTGNYIATATRLLSMKRPDTFICFDSKNKSSLCKAFGIVQSGMNYERYWNDIIERIYISDWWLKPNPRNDQEEKVSNARAAFLDSLYYKE